MRNLVVFGGSSHPELTKAVCNRLGISPGKTKLSKFSNNETSVEVHESVREQDVFIIQSGSGHVNDTLFELLILINACKIASAKRITAVIPYFPYSRQADMPFKSSAGAPLERLPMTPRPENQQEASTENVSQLLYQKLAKMSVETNSNNNNNDDECSSYRKWVARSGTLVANLLTCAGADHIISLDMHDPQFQGFFDCPFDNLVSMPLMIRYIKLNIPNYQDAVIVSPDAGGAKRATAIAEKLCMDFALIHKERRQVSTQKRDLMLVGDVRGKECILIDDICDTSYTITRAARMLRENGALKVYAIVCHAILSGSALENIEKSDINQIVVSNSIPQNEHLQSSKIKVFDVAPLFAEAIRRIHFGESVSMLFDAQHEIV